MRQLICILITIFFFLHAVWTTAASSVVTPDMPLADALHTLATSQKINIMVSPEVTGTVSLSLQDLSAKQAFERLLHWHHLATIRESGMLFVMPQADYLRHRQRAAQEARALLATEPLETRILQIRYADAADAGRWIGGKNTGQLSPRGSFQVDSRTNQLIVHDTHTSLERLQKLIRRLDIPVRQIVIETRLATVDSHFERDLGLMFSAPGSDSETTGIPDSSHFQLQSPVIAHLTGSRLLDVRLRALEQSGHGRLISSPRLFTANRQPARIESGEEIPYQEISRSGATGIAFRKAVLSLEVTPEIMPGRRVHLTLNINQDKPASRLIQGVPAISTRRISSNILVKDGQTIVLGGIYENDDLRAEAGIPFLSRIPVIGSLFQYDIRSRDRRELLIFVTPRII